MMSSDKKGTVILVDDDPINNLVTKRLLQKINPTIAIVDFTNAIDALEHLKSSRIDLILLDINMPGRKFRKQNSCNNVKFVNRPA
jgi:CheY-like chemotaxis protein